MKALILSGGQGTRLRPLTYSQQKQLIPVANRPVLFYAIDDCVEAGATDVGIITGPNADQVRETVLDAYDDGEWPEAEFTFIHQGDPKGIAHTIMVAEEEGFLDAQTPFVMYLGDNILSGGIKHLADDFRNRIEEIGIDRVGGSIMLCPVDRPEAFGIAELDDEGRIVNLVEKPDNPPSNRAVIGVYFFTPSVLKATRQLSPSWRGEYEITEAIQWLIDQGYEVKSDQVRGWWKDTGEPRDLLGANRLVLDDLRRTNANVPNGDVEAEIIGRVRIEDGAVVDGSSTLKGPLHIGANATITNSYVGPYTSIGPDCVLENAEVEDSILLDGSKVHGIERVRESVIGRGAVVEPSDGRPAGRRIVMGDEAKVEL